MSREVNIEQTKAAKQENITELSDDQLAEAAGGGQGTGPGDEITLEGSSTPEGSSGLVTPEELGVSYEKPVKPPKGVDPGEAKKSLDDILIGL